MNAIEDDARSIFLTALECTPDQWPAFLDEACRDNAEVRARVEQLLHAHQEMGSIHGGGAGDPVATVDEVPVAERPGTMIGPYKLLQKIGEGGMGVVYMAEQTEPVKRKVALKVIKPGMDSRQVVARFEAERQALALMDHVNIARVFDGGTTGASVEPSGRRESSEPRRADASTLASGRPYFVMELVHGVPITKYCDDNHLTPRERLELFVPVCQAIQHAHQKGIIHRDIKPSNVMVTLYDGKPVPKVIDFGVAKATEQKLTERTLFTQYGTMVGTFEYMSPEQAEMSALGVDTRSDIYSLGVLLYELLTGSTPLTHKQMKEAAYAEILRMIKEEEPPKPSTRLSDSGEALASISANRHMEPAKLTKLVRGELDWIVMKTLEKDRNRRYETAKDFAADVQRYLDDEQVQACPPSAWYRLRKALRKHRVLATLLSISAIAGLALVGLMVGLIYNHRLQNANTKLEVAVQETQQQKGEADSQRWRAEQQEALVRRLLYLSRINMADRAWQDGNIARMDELLQEQRPQDANQEDLRGFEWHYLWRLRHSSLLTLKGHTCKVNSVVFSRDGRQIASGGGELNKPGEVQVWDARTGQQLLSLKKHGDIVWSVAFSPDGTRLASASQDHTVKVWDAQSGQETLIFKGHTGAVRGVAFSPDGLRIVSAAWMPGEFNRPCELKVWDARTGQEGLTLKGLTGMVTSVAFSPDGLRIVSGGGELHKPGVVKVWDAQTGEETLNLQAPIGLVHTVAFRPDGKQVACASQDQTVKVWDAQTGQEVLSLGGHIGVVNGVAFSPDGKHLASAGAVDKTVKVWDAHTGQLILTMKGHIGPISSLAFSPDGMRLASASWDQTVKVWDAHRSQEAQMLWGHTQPVECVTFSPDGKRLASASWDATVKVWEPQTSQDGLTAYRPALWLRGHAKPVESVAFSLDGKHLASGSADQTVKVWDARTGKETRTLQGHTDTVWGVAFSPAGQRLASASADQTVKVWNAHTGEDILTLKGHTKEVWGVAFSPDGKHLASAACDHTIKVWNAHTGAEIMTLNGHTSEVTSVVYSPDGLLLASSANDDTVKVWDAQTGKVIMTLKGHAGAVTRVAFSPDGKRLASASEGNTVQLWDTQTGEEALSLKGHTDAVQSVAFSPDGKRLASAAMDQTVRVWDATGDEPAKGSKAMTETKPQKHPDELKGIKSQNADVAATILFINTSKQVIKIFWLDYDGRRQLYQILDGQPGGDGPNWPCHLQQTCLMHPWLITDEHDNAWHVFRAQPKLPTESGLWTLEVLGKSNVKAVFQKVRNPFGLPDVPDPEGADVQKFATTVTLVGGTGDANAALWPQGTVAGIAGSIDGDWATRWNGGGADQWQAGAAVVKIVGDRFFFLQRQNCTFLIEAKRVGKDRLVGRYVNLEVPTDSYPWVGHIVDHERIDGAWTHGRWDLRRKISDKPPPKPDQPMQPDAIANSFRQGYNAMTKGEYDRAIAFYSETVRLDPQHHQAYVHRAVAFYNKGDIDRAIADNTKAIEAAPNYAPAYRNRGREYGELGKHDLAIADFAMALKLEPQDASAYCDLGWNFLQKRDYAKSIADSTEAIRLDAKLVEAYRNRANAYRALGEVKKADDDDRKAKELNK